MIGEHVSELGFRYANIFTEKEPCLGEKKKIIWRGRNSIRSRKINIKMFNETS